jgi:O-methyltransferase
MYNLIKALYQKLPENIKTQLQPLIPSLMPLISKNERLRIKWLKGEFTPYGNELRNELLLSVARFCNANRPVGSYYFEFGCHSGNTMRMAWKHSRHLFDWTYIGFDSFEGLPEIQAKDDQEIWEKGKLATDEDDFIRIVTSAGMPKNRLKTVKGFYDQTLTKKLADDFGDKKAAAIYIDCDLYESTVPILKFIKGFLQIGTIIIFDDWYCFHGDPIRGEQRAWSEFLERNPDLRFVEFVRTCEANSFIYLGNQEEKNRIDQLYAVDQL